MIAELLEARREYSRQFRRQDRIRVVGIGVGMKHVGARRAADLSVQVFVAAKRPLHELALRERIPADIDGIPIDIVESPAARFSGATAATANAAGHTLRIGRSKYRPLKAGVSCSNLYSCAGTLGAFCEGLNRDGRPSRFILGCGHVLRGTGAYNKTTSAVIQASPADGGSSRDTVAVLARDIPVRAGVDHANTCDAAIAELLPDIEYSNEIVGIGGLAGKTEPQLGMRILKSGRTTGVTAGVVTSIALETSIAWGAQNFTTSRFTDLFRIEAEGPGGLFAQGGDSGALVVTAEKHDAAGLYFAGGEDGSFGLAARISTVEHQLEVQLITAA
jgi:hypothetical protein